MAEFVMKDLLAKAGCTHVSVASAAMHTDEIGSDVHWGTQAKLRGEGIPFSSRMAWLLTAEKAHDYDLLIGMDAYNVADLRRLVYPEDRDKIHYLLDFAGLNRDVDDPWYTGDFDATYRDVVQGCTALLQHLRNVGRTARGIDFARDT